MEDIIKLFHVDWKLLVAQLVNFALVFGGLYWFGLRKLGVFMDQRAKTIAEGVKNAQENSILKQQIQEEKAEVIKQARTEAETVVSGARDDAKRHLAKVKKEAEEKSASIISLAEAEAAAKKEAVIADSRKTIISLATNMARMTFKELGVAEQSEVAKAAIKKIESDM